MDGIGASVPDAVSCGKCPPPGPVPAIARVARSAAPTTPAARGRGQCREQRNDDAHNNEDQRDAGTNRGFPSAPATITARCSQDQTRTFVRPGRRSSSYLRATTMRSESEQITRRSTLPRSRSGLQRIRRDSPKSAALSTELRARRAKSKRLKLRAPNHSVMASPAGWMAYVEGISAGDVGNVIT